MEYVYVTGHKNPDTDSIASAMAYANLKNEIGEIAVPVRLGPLNEETKYATREFDVEAPPLVKDARCKLRDIELDEVIEIKETDTCNKAYNLVIKTSNKTLYVTDDNHCLIGLVSISDLTSIRLADDKKRNKLLSYATISCIAKDTKSKVLVDNKNFSFNGKVHIFENVDKEYEDSLILVSNEKNLDSVLRTNPSLVIYTGEKINQSIIKNYEKKHVALLHSKLDYENILRIINEAIPVKYIMSTKPICYYEDEYVDEIFARVNNTRYRAYPVIDRNGKILGSISRWHLYNYNKKKFVLVDHSSKSQTIDNIDMAEVVEIVDHHHVGDIETKVPIYYRNQKLGCTCSIIYQMYLEKNVKPPKKIAGMMLSAIISDTLNFKSKTTTQFDIDAAKQLAKIAGIKDINEYATRLLSASVNLLTADIKELLQRDLKQYKFGDLKVAVSQTNYDKSESIQKRLPDIKKTLFEYQQAKNLDLLILMFTHVEGNGTSFFYYGPKAYIMENVIDTIIDEHSGFDSTIISRKQQLIPKLSEVIQMY